MYVVIFNYESNINVFLPKTRDDSLENMDLKVAVHIIYSVSRQKLGLKANSSGILSVPEAASVFQVDEPSRKGKYPPYYILLFCHDNNLFEN